MASGPKVVLRWDGTTAVPAAPIDRWALKELPVGQLLEAVTWKPRNAKLMARIHVMLQIGEDNSLGWPREKIKTSVKLANGWVKGASVDVDGTVYCEVKSLADFTNEELGRYAEQLQAFILEEVCPGLDPTLLQREVDHQTAERRG